MTYIVGELALCQSRRKDGYVAAIPDGDRIWGEVRRGEIRSQGFDLNGGWVPWYTMHKLFAGLIDAYEQTGSKAALRVVRGLGDWAIGVTANLDHAKWQRMLACEHGGMNESLAELYAISKAPKYLALSRKFHHDAVLDPLAAGRDELAGKHANTQIPKLIGLARLYEIEGRPEDRKAAETFWECVVRHHTYAMGGNSDHEHFGPPDRLSDRLTSNSAETCNTYNMLKLSRHLFEWRPRVAVADFYEKGLYNHILGSQDPKDGMMCYYVDLSPGGERVHSTPFDSFWCCVGSGIENHTKYADSIYYHAGGERLWVNGFVPSTLRWREAGVELRQATRYPEDGHVVIEVTKGDAAFEMAVRHPLWAKETMTLRVNGQTWAGSDAPGEYVRLSRRWKTGDRVEFDVPMTARLEPMPDDAKRAALMVGPLAMAADLAPEDAPKPAMPVVVSDDPAFASLVERKDGEWRTKPGVGRPGDLTFRPFWTLQHRRYSLYFDRMTPAEWSAERARLAAEEARRRAMEARTTDALRIGEMQPERDHEVTGERTEVGDVNGQKWRHATGGGWFSFTMAVDGSKPNELVLTYWGADEGGREFDILVNGQKVATQTLRRQPKEGVYDVTYPVPEALTRGKAKVTVRLQAHPGMTAGGLFGARMMRAE